MPTTFLLDPRVLDDCVGDGVKAVEIEAEAVVFVRKGFDDISDYGFYVTNDISSFIIPSGLKQVHHRVAGVFGEVNLLYQKASISFHPMTEGEKYIFGPNLAKEFLETAAMAIKRYDVLCVNEDFLKGDAETLKNYGVTIKPQ